MNWIVFHITSGGVFLSGSFCVVLATFFGIWKKTRFRAFSPLLALLDLLSIVVSATPFPYWYYGLVVVVMGIWLFTVRSEKVEEKRRRVISSVAMTVILLGVVWELPWQITPTINSPSDEPLTIYADSITAGLGENEGEPWTEILERTKHAKIFNRARVGATVGSALTKAKETTDPRGIVLLEIGGNDLLGNTKPDSFEHNLDELLSLLSSRHRRVLMFELPLPPTYNSFGEIQRRLSKKHGVVLIPKCVLMGVLSGDSATLDSIHLSQADHQRMAETVWRILGRQ